MYITITAQQTGENFSQSSADFVNYLEKENEGKTIEEQEHFFNQYREEVSAEEVIREIDGNKAKLKRDEPKFYSITVNPSARELKHLQNHSKDLKAYTGTAKYYERFFEIIKNPTRSISKRTGLSWESRVTKGEREVPKRRAEIFFRLKQGEFIAFADGKDKNIQFKFQKKYKEMPKKRKQYSDENVRLNFIRVFKSLQ